MSVPGAFPEPLVAAYRTIARDEQARAEYLDGLRRFGALEKMAPSAVIGEIDALAAKLAGNENMRVLVRGAQPDDGGGDGPGVGDLLPDAAQQAVIERLFERLQEGTREHPVASRRHACRGRDGRRSPGVRDHLAAVRPCGDRPDRTAPRGVVAGTVREALRG